MKLKTSCPNAKLQRFIIEQAKANGYTNDVGLPTFDLNKNYSLISLDEYGCGPAGNGSSIALNNDYKMVDIFQFMEAVTAPRNVVINAPEGTITVNPDGTLKMKGILISKENVDKVIAERVKLLTKV